MLFVYLPVFVTSALISFASSKTRWLWCQNGNFIVFFNDDCRPLFAWIPDANLFAVIIQDNWTVGGVTIDVIHPGDPASQQWFGEIDFLPQSRSQLINSLNSNNCVWNICPTAGVIFVIRKNFISFKCAVYFRVPLKLSIFETGETQGFKTWEFQGIYSWHRAN